jgi:hypothetical protein
MCYSTGILDELYFYSSDHSQLATQAHTVEHFIMKCPIYAAERATFTQTLALDSSADLFRITMTADPPTNVKDRAKAITNIANFLMKVYAKRLACTQSK